VENGRKNADISVVCKIGFKKGYQFYYWYVIINEPGMEGGVLVTNQIHLDERLAACA
jgi:hypothetical protein